MQDNPTPTSLVANLDTQALLFSFAVALVISLLVTMRARNLQRLAGRALSPWSDVLTDTLLGGVLGSLGSLWAAQHVDALRSGPGVLLASALLAAIAPKLTDWLQDNGVGTLRRWLAGMAGGAADALQEDTDDVNRKT